MSEVETLRELLREAHSEISDWERCFPRSATVNDGATSKLLSRIATALAEPQSDAEGEHAYHVLETLLVWTDEDWHAHFESFPDLAERVRAQLPNSGTSDEIKLLKEARSCVEYQKGMQNLNNEAGKKHAVRFADLLKRIDHVLNLKYTEGESAMIEQNDFHKKATEAKINASAAAGEVIHVSYLEELELPPRPSLGISQPNQDWANGYCQALDDVKAIHTKAGRERRG